MREGDASDAPASRRNFCWSIGRGCPLRLDNRLDSRTPVPAWGLPAGLYGEDASPYPAGYAAVGMSAPASSAFACGIALHGRIPFHSLRSLGTQIAGAPWLNRRCLLAEGGGVEIARNIEHRNGSQIARKAPRRPDHARGGVRVGLGECEAPRGRGARSPPCPPNNDTWTLRNVHGDRVCTWFGQLVTMPLSTQVDGCEPLSILLPGQSHLVQPGADVLRMNCG